MKLLRHGFAFVIAILTIGLTIAAHAGAFKSEAKNFQATCLEDVDMGTLVLNNVPECPVSELCIDETEYGDYRAIEPLTSDVICNPVTNPPFCCAKVTSQEDGCGFVIEEVFCGERIPL